MEGLHVIRPMEEKDLKEVNDIYNHAILHTTALWKEEPESLEQRKEWYKQKQQNGDPMFVYEENNQVIGFVTFSNFYPYPAYRYTVEHSVYVHKNHYRKGIGTKLLKFIIEEANKRQIKTMIASIASENSDSINLHEKLGFYFAGEIKNCGYKFGRWLSYSFYQLDLEGPGF